MEAMFVDDKPSAKVAQSETKGDDDVLPKELFDRKVKQVTGILKSAVSEGVQFQCEKLVQTPSGYQIYEQLQVDRTVVGGVLKASAYTLGVFALLDHKLDGLAALVDPAQQAQNAAEAAARIAELEVKSVARIAALELKVASAAEIGAAAQPVLAALERQNTALERVEASLAAQNTRLAALEARPVCCIIS